MNEWGNIAKEHVQIQRVKNRVLNRKVFECVRRQRVIKGKVLEYGCGWGEFAELLAEKGFMVDAFDPADEMIHAARARYTKPRFYTKKEFGASLLKCVRQYSLVVSNLVLCILSEQQQHTMISELKRVSKPDAPIVLSFCHPCTDYLSVGAVSKRLGTAIRHRYDKIFRYRKVLVENNITCNDYHRPLEYYTALFKKHSLEIVDISESAVTKVGELPDFIIFCLRKSKARESARR